MNLLSYIIVLGLSFALVQAFYNSELFFEDVFLISIIKFQNKDLTFSSTDKVKIIRSIDFTNSDTIIDSFNSYINFDIDISNFEKNKYNIYESIAKCKKDGIKTKNSLFTQYYNKFVNNVGVKLIGDIYVNDNKIDIYSIDKYKDKYFKLMNLNNNLELNEENLWSLYEKNKEYLNEDIIKNSYFSIALLYRQIKTVNKLLTGGKLSKFDIFFTDIFCESGITILYNMNLFTKSLSTILESMGIDLEPDYVMDLFNKNQIPDSNQVIALLQSSIKYYTNNNNDAKYVNLYGVFNAINSYIYYNYNYIEQSKKYKMNEDYAIKVYEYLIKMENDDSKYHGLNSINLSRLDYIKKKYY
ncbi:hypothetical protein BCR36DRAFT_368933 [Piromyces finnis]|uniref:Uncharacterized protein n=1 Tax=Piromyces finnis TaxID=1754191 RepID=A0A1Y1VD59_9FUNG|nr:hypothetical protein BCR36DRAFT_368933 [Piromyces finnis]|eukprot:ORX53271.1 hypothetical protein BCR36DRAFT_368933 [Piromyces finnis]